MPQGVPLAFYTLCMLWKRPDTCLYYTYWLPDLQQVCNNSDSYTACAQHRQHQKYDSTKPQIRVDSAVYLSKLSYETYIEGKLGMRRHRESLRPSVRDLPPVCPSAAAQAICRNAMQIQLELYLQAPNNVHMMKASTKRPASNWVIWRKFRCHHEENFHLMFAHSLTLHQYANSLIHLYNPVYSRFAHQTFQITLSLCLDRSV